MRTITRKYKVYKFEELPEETKEKILEKLYDININYDWWDFICDDAKNIGIDITEFDLDRGNKINGKLLISPLDSINKVLSDHGDKTDTYKTALEYKPTFEKIYNSEYDDYYYQEKKETYLYDMLENYLSRLKKEYEYLTTNEAIIETINANDYDFLENGNIFV